MSQTEETAPNSSEEKIRKIYARDLKIGDAVHTVFKAAGKEKVTSRAGKTFLTLSMVDKTGEVDARIFDGVEAAEGAFRDDDYLLVKGKVIAFHGKPQLVVESLERLDAGPIDGREFAYTAAAAPAHSEAKGEPRHELKGGNRAIKQKILELFDDPQVARGVEALLKHLDQYIDERIAMKLGGGSAPREGRKPQIDKRPRVEFKARHEESKGEGEHKSAEKPAHRDPSLPRDLTFKPLSMLAGEPAAPAENSPKPENGN